MDPDANLTRQRALANAVLSGATHGNDYDEIHDDLEDLAALVQSMDDWLSSGGFPPAAWRTHLNPPSHLNPTSEGA